jgi:hypothetical protein
MADAPEASRGVVTSSEFGADTESADTTIGVGNAPPEDTFEYHE